MTSYRGYDVYDGFLCDQGGDVAENLDRVARTVENPAGRFIVRHDAPAPKRQQSGLLLWCDSRADIAALESFLAVRRGRYSPFWIPSWTSDMEFVSEALDGDGRRVLTVRSSMIARSRIHSEGARDLVGITATGAFVGAARIVSAVDNADGTETITLDDTSGASWASAAMISWMRFVRLTNDEVEIKWLAPDRCTVTLDVTDAWEATPALPPDPIPTRLYWRNVAAAAAPATQQSGKVIVSGGFEAPAGSLLVTKGGPDSAAFNFPGTGAHDEASNGFFPGKVFVSEPLKAQLIKAQSWLFGGAGAVSNAFFAHTTFAIALYVWRPSTSSLVGMIYDAPTELGGTWDLNAPLQHVGVFAGAALSVADGDVLVLEVFETRAGGSYVAGQPFAVYDGPIEPAIGGAWNANAAFIQSTNTLRFL